MSTKRRLLLGGILTTLLIVFSLPVLAQCDLDDPECPLEPPQSVEVNLDKVTTSGDPSYVEDIGELEPVDASLPNPTFIEPVPIDGSANSSSSGVEMSEISSADSTTSSSLSGGAAWAMVAAAAGAIAATAPMVLGSGRTNLSQASGIGSGLKTSSVSSLAGENVPLSGGRPVANTSGGSGPSSASGAGPSVGSGSQIASASGEYQALGRYATGEIPSGQGSSAENLGLSGDRRREDEEDQMLSPAMWIPNPPPTPSAEPIETPTPTYTQTSVPDATPEPYPVPLAPTEEAQTPSPLSGMQFDSDSGHQDGEVNVKAPDKLASLLRSISDAELADSSASSAAAAIASPVRQAAIIASSVVLKTARGGLPGLEDGINSAVHTIGDSFDRASVSMESTLQARIGRSTDFVQAKILGPPNLWASGELGSTFQSRGGISGLASRAWRGLGTQVDKFRIQLSQPNSPSFNAKLHMTSAVGAGLSFLGNAIYNKTGSQTAYDVAGVGEIISGGANLVGLRGKIVQAFSGSASAQAVNAASKWAGVAKTVVRASGVLSAVIGVVTTVNELKNVRRDLSDDGQLSNSGKISAVKAFGGGLATAGGILLLTPFAPFGGVLLGLSGAVSAGAWVAENSDRLRAGIQAWKGVRDNIYTIGRTVINRVSNSVRETASRIVTTTRRVVSTAVSRVTESVRSTVQTVRENVSQTVNTTVNKVKGFLGNLLGGGSTPATPTPRPSPPQPSSTSRTSSYRSPSSSRPTRRFRPRSTRHTIRSRATARSRYRTYRGR